jgi:hypothetical protein
MDERENYTLARKFHESFRFPQLAKPALAVKIIAQRIASLGALTTEPWGAGCRIREKGVTEGINSNHDIKYCTK